MALNPDPAAQIAAEFVSHIAYAALGTTGPSGEAWITPIYFVPTSDLRILWVSGRDARHSRNIAELRNRVSIACYDSMTPFGHAQGVYIEGRASEIPESELAARCEAFYSRRFRDPKDFAEKARRPADFSGDSPRRMYECRVESVFVLDPDGDPMHGRLMDHRVRVPLEAYRRSFVEPMPPPELQTR